MAVAAISEWTGPMIVPKVTEEVVFANLDIFTRLAVGYSALRFEERAQ
jgi:hypothetical protein